MYTVGEEIMSINYKTKTPGVDGVLYLGSGTVSRLK
jgi:hypothetical protein